MRRRRGGLGIFGFILFIMMFDLIDYGIDLLYYFMPLIVFGLVGVGFAKLFQNLFGIGRVQQRKATTYTQSNVRNAKLNSIDRVFSDYYRNNVSFALFDDVSLCTKSGTYSTVDNLYVCYKDEKICQLSELKKTYPGAYEKIIEALGKVTKRDLKAMTEAGKKKQEDNKKKESKKEEKKANAFSQAEEFIEKINSLNNGLNNEEVTNGLYQTCDLLKQIDVVDREDGTVDPKLNQLYEYYLPILEGILTDYKRLSDSPIKGDDFKKCETQLVKTIKLINEALKIIYNSLHEADYMNLNADINTLQSLLKQDGYVETPFNKED